MGTILIGSHNSMTYLRPKKWWMRLISFTSKCQNWGISGQYDMGARYFDLHIRVTKKNKIVFAHGLMEYQENVFMIFNIIKNFNERCYIRIVHENSFGKSTSDSIIGLVEFLIHDMGMNVHCYIDKKTGDVITYNEDIEIHDQYTNYSGKLCIPNPLKEAKKWAKKKEEIHPVDQSKIAVVFRDFVELF